MQKEDSPVIIYFARDDCPDCQEMDSYLHSNRVKLAQTVYRIETRKEPNQHLLKQLLDEQNITKVPTFVQREGQELIKLKLKEDTEKIVFLRLS
ncbi:hypothetical protein C240_15 [Enterococcus sp. 5H]|nr:hypothetical protein [Enterococcus sp. 5H]